MGFPRWRCQGLPAQGVTEGISSPTSFANKLVDTRYREFAAAFNFDMLGESATQTAAATTGTVGKYLRQALEEEPAKQNEGVRLALYFERKAPRITKAYQILADKALLKVVQTALGISPLTSMADVDKQAAMLAKKIDFADFQNPEKLRTFLQRFSVMWETENGEASRNALPSSSISPSKQASAPAPWQACKTSNSEDRPHAISTLCQPVGSSLDRKET